VRSGVVIAVDGSVPEGPDAQPFDSIIAIVRTHIIRLVILDLHTSLIDYGLAALQRSSLAGFAIIQRVAEEFRQILLHNERQISRTVQDYK
jgi:hypothetical protein